MRFEDEFDTKGVNRLLSSVMKTRNVNEEFTDRVPAFIFIQGFHNDVNLSLKKLSISIKIKDEIVSWVDATVVFGR